MVNTIYATDTCLQSISTHNSSLPLLKAMNTKQELFELLSSTRIFQKSFEMFSYFCRKRERNSMMSDDSLSELPQSVQLAEENAVPSIEPEVRDIECVVPPPSDVLMLTHKLKDTTRRIKLLRQTIDPIPPIEFENAKSFVIDYLTLPHISKVINRHQKGFLDAIGVLRRDPALSSYVYEKLTILEHRFPQLVAAYENALHKQVAAESFILEHTHVMVDLKRVNNHMKNNPGASEKRVEDEFRKAESQPAELDNFKRAANKLLNIYQQLEEASFRTLSAKRDMFCILKEVEELCSDINL